MTTSRRCGYYVLVRSPHREDAQWETDWSGKMFLTVTDAVLDAKAAQDAGWDAVVCALNPVGRVFPGGTGGRRVTPQPTCPFCDALHDPRVLNAAQKIVDIYGYDIPVEVPTVGQFRVPRMYIALHGLRGSDLRKLAEKYGWPEVTA